MCDKIWRLGHKKPDYCQTVLQDYYQDFCIDWLHNSRETGPLLSIQRDHSKFMHSLQLVTIIYKSSDQKSGSLS